MSGVSLTNEKQSFKEEGGAIVLMPEDAPNNTPPPAPPLPPPVLVGNPTQRKRRVRSFYWKPIPEERVRHQDRPNLWTLGRHHREQRFHIDIRAIEELFGQRDDTATSSNILRGRSSVKDLRDQISILDSKRCMNISIFLKHLKKSSECLLEDLLHWNSEAFGVESLKELLKLLPEDEEVKNLQMFSGDAKDLTPADDFMYQLIHVPRYELRLKALLLKGEFFPSYSAMKQEITVVLTAITELLNCEELHSVLHLVLQAGNIMNDGGFAGNAVGFKLSSLLSLADTKANKPGMNLLHFVALEAEKKNLLMFPDKLLHVQKAARVCVDSIHVELNTMSTRVDEVQLNIQTDADLLTQLQSFLQKASESLEDLRVCIDEMMQEGNTLIDFFCEDKETFRLDECFKIFQNFCSKFKKAVQENMERGLWEESRRKHIKEGEDKRHSWAGHEGVKNVFGLRSSSQTDVEAALRKEGLLELLRTHPQSPLLQFGSVRHPRQQKVSSQSTNHQDVNFDLTGADIHTLLPIHSLSITNTVPNCLSEPPTRAHNDTNTHIHSDTIDLHGNHTHMKTTYDQNSNTTNLYPEKSKKTHTLWEPQSDNLQTHTQQCSEAPGLEVITDLTFEPSQVSLAVKSEVICASNNQTESSISGGKNVQPTSQCTNLPVKSLNTNDRPTQMDQTRKSLTKPPDSKPRSSLSVKPSPSSKSSPVTKLSSASSKSSSISKSFHQRPVRTLTSSETQSLRKVVPISRPSSSGLQKLEQKSPSRGGHNTSSTKRKQVIRPPPEEKMCQATLRALGTPTPQNSAHSSPNHPTPRFARNTVASTTRHAVAPENKSSQHSTAHPKAPSLTRTASLRLSGVLRLQQNSSGAGSGHLLPPAGQLRKRSGAFSEKALISPVSQHTSVKPAWK